MSETWITCNGAHPLDPAQAVRRRSRWNGKFSCGSLLRPKDVAESKGFIAQHQRLIVQSERDGQDAAETIRLLDKLLLLQQSREQERARILDELSDAS